MAAIVRTYRIYVNDDGSMDLSRAQLKGKRVIGEAFIKHRAVGWTAVDAGADITADITSTPISAANSDVGGADGI